MAVRSRAIPITRSTVKTAAFNTQQIQCGSGLAREGGVSVSCISTEPPHSRASPLPHLDLCQAGNWSAPPSSEGSMPDRECEPTIDPLWERGGGGGGGGCGGGWGGLARESGVSVADGQTDTPHSRASPLPHKPAPTPANSSTRLFSTLEVCRVQITRNTILPICSPPSIRAWALSASV
jgi:hypothetical protein